MRRTAARGALSGAVCCALLAIPAAPCAAHDGSVRLGSSDAAALVQVGAALDEGRKPPNALPAREGGYPACGKYEIAVAHRRALDMLNKSTQFLAGGAIDLLESVSEMAPPECEMRRINPEFQECEQALRQSSKLSSSCVDCFWNFNVAVSPRGASGCRTKCMPLGVIKQHQKNEMSSRKKEAMEQSVDLPKASADCAMCMRPKWARLMQCLSFPSEFKVDATLESMQSGVQAGDRKQAFDRFFGTLDEWRTHLDDIHGATFAKKGSAGEAMRD